MSNLYGKITDLMAIIIRFVRLMARWFWFLWEFIEFLYFLECPPRIIGDFMWRLQRSLQLVIVRLPNNNKNTTVPKFKNLRELNKASRLIWTSFNNQLMPCHYFSPGKVILSSGGPIIPTRMFAPFFELNSMKIDSKI